MRRERVQAGERILLTLWVGGLWSVGYIVAPFLFARLEDRALAGSLAGALFEIMAWLGLACGGLLLLSNQLQSTGRRFNWRALALAIMLVLILVGQFALAPQIAGLREQGLAGTDAFARLHGVAAILYLLTSLLGLVLVAAGPDRGRWAPSSE
ncbi:MAG TPA: DUF4149 domain-containing protein [Gammaproteobacteria bacterium]|nr:DUF4149 domain-containing protein [Gammaproteobacteria bacterium]